MVVAAGVEGRWQVDPEIASTLRLARFDDEALVFNPRTWKTLYLNEAAAYVFEAIARSEASIDELVATLAAQFDDEPTALRELVIAALDRFAELRLVRPAP